MSYQETGDTYVVRWTQTAIKELVNTSRVDKEMLVLILKDDPAANHVSNPIRSMVIQCVLDTRSYSEIWEFQSTLTEEEIFAEFAKCPESLKAEIMEVGTEIYSSHKFFGEKLKC